MKKVFPNANAVIHLFAQRTQSEARSTNVFFEYGTKLYSYGHHYLLAEFIENNAIMINDSGYSVTTAKHIRQVTGATRQYKQFFYTKTNLGYIHREVKSNLDKLAKAKKPELYLGGIFSMWESLNEFIQFKKATKDYAKNPQYKELKKWVKQLEGDKDKVVAKIKELQDRERVIKLAKFKKDVKEFEAYELNYIHSNELDWIRISQDGTKVESSQGVSVSIEAARVLYKMIEAKRDIIGHRIEGYTVISVNGKLKIGCHHIDMEAVHKVGKIITQ